MTGAGRTEIAAGAVLNMTQGNRGMEGRTLRNGGSARWSGSNSLLGAQGAVFHDLAGGVFHILNDVTLSDARPSLGPPLTLRNAGQMDLGNGAIPLRFMGNFEQDPTGVLNVDHGGTGPP